MQSDKYLANPNSQINGITRCKGKVPPTKQKSETYVGIKKREQGLLALKIFAKKIRYTTS